MGGDHNQTYAEARGNVAAFYGWKLLLVLASIVAVNLGVTFVGAAVINAAMAKDLHLSRGLLGLGFTVFIITNGCAAPVVAKVVNAWGARRSLCIGSLLVALGALVLATWVSEGWHYVLAYGLIIGLGNAFGALIPAQSCATTWFEKRRVLALSLVLVGSGVGGLISAPFLAHVIVAANGNWRAAWYCVAAVALAAASTAWFFVRNRPGDCGQRPDGIPDATGRSAGTACTAVSTVYHAPEHWTIRQAVRTPALWLLSLAAVGESVSSTSALAHAVPHLRDLGHSPEAAAAAMSTFAFCTVAGKLSIGLLCDRFDPRNAWAACILMMGIAVWVATRAQGTLAMYLFTGMLGFGSGAALVSWHATVANYFGPPAFASILGAQMPFTNTLSAAGPFLVGVLYDRQGTYTPAFYGIAAFAVFTAVMLLTAKPPKHNKAVSGAHP